MDAAVIDDALDRYFDAWNARDPLAVVASLADDGTYEDPMTGGPIAGVALSDHVAALITGFPDVHFDVVSRAGTGPTSAAAQWVMRGTNTGPMPGGPPTGATIALPGADFIDVDPASGLVSRVVGYFDNATMLTQLGLQAHVSPADIEPVTRFGLSLRVDTGRDAQPGAFTVTWIDVPPEHKSDLVDATSAIVMDLLGHDAYLGSCIATIGRRNYTFSAWTTVDAARAALHGGAHARAMRLMRENGVGEDAFGITSIWVPDRLGGVLHAGTGRAAELSSLEGQWL